MGKINFNNMLNLIDPKYYFNMESIFLKFDLKILYFGHTKCFQFSVDFTLSYFLITLATF